MNAPAFKETITTFIKKITGKDLLIETGLLDEGILDSLLTIELIIKLEETFEITIPSNELTHHNFNSIASIIHLVSSLKRN